MTGGSSNLASLGTAIQRRSRVAVEVWAPTERMVVEGKEIDRGVLGARAAQLSVALGLALRKDREARQ